LGDGLKDHAAGSLNGPFVVLFEKECAHETDDGVVVWEDANDVGAAVDLAVETLDGICRTAWSNAAWGRSCRRARPPRHYP
jgi:hypothetical protein